MNVGFHAIANIPLKYTNLKNRFYKTKVSLTGKVLQSTSDQIDDYRWSIIHCLTESTKCTVSLKSNIYLLWDYIIYFVMCQNLSRFLYCKGINLFYKHLIFSYLIGPVCVVIKQIGSWCEKKKGVRYKILHNSKYLFLYQSSCMTRTKGCFD